MAIKEELIDLAFKINAHLKKIERSRSNSIRQTFYGAHARADRGFVHVCYVNYQGSSKLTVEEATAYLAWLDEGNVGTHYVYQNKHPRINDETLCIFPEKSYWPHFGDPLIEQGTRGEDNPYHFAIKQYFDALSTFFPTLKLTKKQDKYKSNLIPKLSDFYPHGTFPTHHCLSEEQQEAASLLYQTLSEVANIAFERGLNHGRNLLSQLAKGELAVGDFETPFKEKEEVY